MGTKEGVSEDKISAFKEAFAKELAGIHNVDELKDIYASEIARRDELISKLQEQNQLLLSSMIKSKKDEIVLNTHSERAQKHK